MKPILGIVIKTPSDDPLIPDEYELKAMIAGEDDLEPTGQVELFTQSPGREAVSLDFIVTGSDEAHALHTFFEALEGTMVLLETTPLSELVYIDEETARALALDVRMENEDVSAARAAIEAAIGEAVFSAEDIRAMLAAIGEEE